MVASNPGVMLQALVWADRHLGRQSAAVGEHGSAHDGGIGGINQRSPADDDEAAVTVRISLWSVDAIDFGPASYHFAGTLFFRKVAEWRLIFQGVQRVTVQLLCIAVDD
jgi:hypothetical protein